MELRDYLRGLRRHWLAVVLMTLVGVGVAAAWVSVQTPIYESTAQGVIQSKATAAQGGAVYGDTYAVSKVPTYLEMSGWNDVAKLAGQQIGSSESPAQLASQVTVTNPTGTAILQFVARGSSPQKAATLAQAWITALSTTIDKVEGDGTKGSAGITIYPAAAATVATTPVFPEPRTALLIGGVLGLGVGIAFALVRTASDRRIRANDDVESRIGVSVVGTIPLSPAVGGGVRKFDPAAGSDKGNNFAVTEAMRSLRTNLRFMDVDNPPRSIVVTSPLPGDGKSTVAVNLAIALAQGGERVVLIDGDLRRPTVARTMGLPGGAGLSDVLTDRADITDVLQRAPDISDLYVLTAGTIPPNPSEVLGSERMHRLLEELAGAAMVIIDAPPLIPVTDSAVLANQADGALVVVSVGKTTYDLAEKALDALKKANGRALGVALNKAPVKGADASPYAHAYSREYFDATQPVSPESGVRRSSDPQGGFSFGDEVLSRDVRDDVVVPYDASADVDADLDALARAVDADSWERATPEARDVEIADEGAEGLTFDDLLAAQSAPTETPGHRRARRSHGTA